MYVIDAALSSHNNRDSHFVQKLFLLDTILFTEILILINLISAHRPGLLTRSFDECIEVANACWQEQQKELQA